MLIEKPGNRQIWNPCLQPAGLRSGIRTMRWSPIVAAMKNAIDGDLRDSLLRIVCKIPGDAATQAIDEEMRNSSEPRISVTAAHELLRRGRKDVVPAMIAIWDRLNTKDSHGTSPVERMSYGAIAPLIRFLADCDDPAAVEALAKHLGKQDAALRLTIVEAFDLESSSSRMPSGSASTRRSDGAVSQPPKAVLEAIEKLLATALDDTEQCKERPDSLPNKPLSNPRICDMAAHVLAQRFPKEYSFDVSAPLPDQERQRLTAINTWRKRKQQ